MTALGVEQGAVYEIVGPRGDRAVIGPDPADPDFVGYLTEPPSGLERANVRENADELAEADGGLHGDFLYGRLAFTMKGLVYPDAGAASSRQDKLMRATDAMDADAPATALWTSELGVPVQVDFHQQQPTRITDRRPKTFLLAGVSEDPVVYSQAEHQAIVLPDALVAGGFSSPLSSPLVSAPAVGGQAVIENAGRSKTYPRLLVVGPCSNAYIQHVELGRTLYFKNALGAGEFLEIDTNPKRRRILLNGAIPYYRALDSGRSRWWPLLPRTNTIRIGYSAYSAGAQVQVFHRDAWG